MNDTAHFNQSTLSDESTFSDESKEDGGLTHFSNALLNDIKDGSEDAVFNGSFSFSGEKQISNKQKLLSEHRMLCESTNESESTESTDEGTLSGENEDGSE